MLLLSGGHHQDVVNVDINPLQATGDEIHETLKGLGRVAEAERHPCEFEEAERGDDGSERNCSIRQGDLMEGTHQVNFAEDCGTMQVTGEVLDVWQWVFVRHGDRV